MGVRLRKGGLVLGLVCARLYAADATGASFAEKWVGALKGDETGLESKADLSYCVARGEKLLAEWVRPLDKRDQTEEPEPRKLPVMLVLHGNGGTGKRDPSAQALARHFARKGYLAVSVDYRNTAFPEPVLDVRCAVRWIKGSAEALEADAQKVSVVGIGFGGYLAVLLAASGEREKFPKTGDLTEGAKKATSGVRAAINLFGPTELQNQYWKENSVGFRGPRILSTFLPVSPVADLKLFLMASPPAHLSEESSPVFTIHGTKDDIHPFEHAAFLDEQMRRAQIAHTLHPVPGANHGLLEPNGELKKERLLSALDAAGAWLSVSLRHDPIKVAAEAKQKEEAERAPAETQKDPLDEWW